MTGSQMTPAAKVLAVADVADALMSARPYRGPLSTEQVVAMLEDGRGTQFWPDAVEAMAAGLG